MPFKPIETQEEFDAAIKDRLERERKKVEGGYADYDDLKKRLAEYEAKEGDGRAALDKALEEVRGLKEEAAKRAKADELAKVRAKVAQETKVPESVVASLSGTDEESLTEQAKAVAEAYKAPAAPVLREVGRGHSGGPDDDENRSFVRQLLGRE